MNDYKDNGIAGRGYYIFCSSVKLGTAALLSFDRHKFVYFYEGKN